MDEAARMPCRSGCAACCIAASIRRPIPGMPNGKPAGVPCVNLTDDLRCAIWGSDDYPIACRDFSPEPAVCGSNRDEALMLIEALEIKTA